MITETIGSSGRTRSTIQLWEDNLGTAGVLADNETGECYNDSEFVTTAATDFSGTTAGAFNITLKCASGQSFQDNAGVRTNGLRYNVSNGVGIRQTSGYTKVFTGSQDKITFQGLQIKNDAGENSNSSTPILLSGATVTIKDCFVSGIAATLMVINGASNWVINTVGYLSGTTGSGFVSQANNNFLGCTVLRASDKTAAGTGFSSLYSTNILQSCASFGFSTCANGSGWDGTNSKNNATDQASGLPGTSNQHSVTYNATTPFTQAATTGSIDLRAIASTSLAANGYRDSTNGPNDISATARTATPTIGHWEIVSGGGGSGLPFFMQSDLKAGYFSSKSGGFN